MSLHKPCWGVLSVLAEKMNFPKAPVEVIGLLHCSMGKSSLACLWDPNTKRSISHLAKVLSEAACQCCSRKCSNSAFQAVLQIHPNSCQEAVLSNGKSEISWDRRGRQLVLVIRDHLNVTRFCLLGVERQTITGTRSSSFYGDISACFAVTRHSYLRSCHLSSHRESRIFWSGMLRPMLKYSEKSWLSLPLRYSFSKIHMTFCRVNFHFSMASSVLLLHGQSLS